MVRKGSEVFSLPFRFSATPVLSSPDRLPFPNVYLPQKPQSIPKPPLPIFLVNSLSPTSSSTPFLSLLHSLP